MDTTKKFIYIKSVTSINKLASKKVFPIPAIRHSDAKEGWITGMSDLPVVEELGIYHTIEPESNIVSPVNPLPQV